jgi:hypothetical protein
VLPSAGSEQVKTPWVIMTPDWQMRLRAMQANNGVSLSLPAQDCTGTHEDILENSSQMQSA